MISGDYIVLIVFLLCVAVYTVSYGVWTWKKGNRFGAIMVFLVAVLTVALPVYILIFKEV
ncbi:MAG: hypothetical protein GXX04_02505 [Clostridiaceae bacterium]|mgnify:CR=1 FL=1|nr:hypothetical protein [Clostridiaceae bacterium]HPU45589.1 hypothetical protein [Thermoclostridium sp.]